MTRIFVNMDGVLSDFESQFKRTFNNQTWDELFFNIYKMQNLFVRKTCPPGVNEQLLKDTIRNVTFFGMWTMINGTPKFWRKMPETEECHKLWKFLKFYEFYPMIAAPIYEPLREKMVRERRRWIRKHMSHRIPLVTVFYDWENPAGGRRDLLCENEFDILISTNSNHIEAWNKRGGYGILHTTLEDTLNQLKNKLTENGDYNIPRFIRRLRNLRMWLKTSISPDGKATIRIIEARHYPHFKEWLAIKSKQRGFHCETKSSINQ